METSAHEELMISREAARTDEDKVRFVELLTSKVYDEIVPIIGRMIVEMHGVDRIKIHKYQQLDLKIDLNELSLALLSIRRLTNSRTTDLRNKVGNFSRALAMLQENPFNTKLLSECLQRALMILD